MFYFELIVVVSCPKFSSQFLYTSIEYCKLALMTTSCFIMIANYDFHTLPFSSQFFRQLLMKRIPNWYIGHALTTNSLYFHFWKESGISLFLPILYINTTIFMFSIHRYLFSKFSCTILWYSGAIPGRGVEISVGCIFLCLIHYQTLDYLHVPQVLPIYL